MSNILDYLDWRGDLTMAQAPFNEVDNLILTELAYLKLQGVVPPVGTGERILLREAARQFFALAEREPERRKMGVLLPEGILTLLKQAAESRRFGEMGLSCYAEHLDTRMVEQFAALSFEVDRSTVYLAFRGTDDTIAGWKEDFLMACQPVVPAQRHAQRYVRVVAKQYPRRKLMLGGHSKGGNLATYAGIFAPQAIQRRICAIWSNDGPGFQETLLEREEHRRVAGRIHTTVPKSSVVGMLLEHEEDYQVVDSDQKGLLQHDGLSWQVKGDHFIHLREVTRQSRLGDRALRQWLYALPVEQRGRLVDALFEVLTASGAETLTELQADRLKTAVSMVRSLADLDSETREGLGRLLTLLLRSGAQVLMEELHAEGEKRTRKWTERERKA